MFDTTSKAGTATGTIVIFFANISNGDLIKTAVLAAVGAAVSFIVTMFLKKLIRWKNHR